MITLDEYFRGRPHTDEQEQAADALLTLVNTLMVRYENQTGRSVPVNPMTHSQIGGVTEGGFRLPDCPQGALHSAHKSACAVDVYDPNNFLDLWITDETLEECDLYREHPSQTATWCHLSTRKPPSGKRSFFP